MKETHAAGTAPSSRRSVLVAAVTSAASAAAATLRRLHPPGAANGDPLIIGTQNTGGPTFLEGDADTTLTVVSPTVMAVEGRVTGGSSGGTGVRGLTFAQNGIGVVGQAMRAGATGVWAGNASPEGTGLFVRGKVRHFTRSGRATVAAGRSSVDVDLRAKGGLGGTPLCFANLMTHRPGVFVTTVRPNHPVAGKVRIYLNRTVPGNTHVAWSVLN